MQVDQEADGVVHLDGTSGVLWQPPAGAALCCLYSPTLNAVVLHGGIIPGHGRTGEIAIGTLPQLTVNKKKGNAPKVPPQLTWSKLQTTMSIPPRAYHGYALLPSPAGDLAFLFGGEGDPPTRQAETPVRCRASPAPRASRALSRAACVRDRFPADAGRAGAAQ